MGIQNGPNNLGVIVYVVLSVWSNLWCVEQVRTSILKISCNVTDQTTAVNGIRTVCLHSWKLETWIQLNVIMFGLSLLLYFGQGYWQFSCIFGTCILIHAVYDVTIAYKHRLPDFLDIIYGTDPSEVHIHIRTVKLCDIPTSEDEVTDWMIERFRQKDQLLSDFFMQGHFPDEGTEGDVSTPECLANFIAIVSSTGFFLYLSLFSSVWFKVYVLLSCAYLTFVTYFSIQPPQLICSSEGGTHAKKVL